MVLDDSPELAASAPEVAASAHGVAASAHVIDLTLDSDDDDDDRPLSATVRPPPARARQSSDTPLASGSGSGIANAHANANANAHAPTPRLAAPLRPAALPQHLARHVNAAGRSLPRHESSAMSSVSNGVHDDARPRAGTSAGTMSSNPPEEDEEPLRAGKRQKPSGSGNANLTADDSMELSIRGRAAARSDADADAAAAADSSATASFHSARSWDATGTANYSLGSSNLPHRSEAWDMVDEDEEMEAALRWDDANDDMDVGATRTRTFL
ncbi:hypothetical protein IE81DRAFT_23663 [Ceraceosorus guamensis]|uniref:Uncharacterized protein n=1 Tax=Ceraceosorus guamensis TaxID=1522189 RepID=A0A316VQH4_9BASI|nr:hypothetical protein IE81DRAFT_23663 [Ceraceosorus guamensis]PWN39494.1 hypothetical protein IE81DRAFT_23663 [Ceraceosorus guamensis]